jgi:Fe-coproporphyrin III synthase
MGNIREVKSFEELWYSAAADEVRGLVRTCPKNCWMVGTAAPMIKKYIRQTGPYVAKLKAQSLSGHALSRDATRLPHFDVGQDEHQGDLGQRGAAADPEAESMSQVAFAGDFAEDDALVQRERGGR